MRIGLHPVPTKIHGYPVIAHRPATVSRDEICVVVLVRRQDEYVTWTYNLQNPGASGGVYDQTLSEAAADFAERHRRERTITRDVTITSFATAKERSAVSNAAGAATIVLGGL